MPFFLLINLLIIFVIQLVFYPRKQNILQRPRIPLQIEIINQKKNDLLLHLINV